MHKYYKDRKLCIIYTVICTEYSGVWTKQNKNSEESFSSLNCFAKKSIHSMRKPSKELLKIIQICMQRIFNKEHSIYIYKFVLYFLYLLNYIHDTSKK